ncbi:hypothetical protein COW46_03355, partial [Candidatus Gracilibacteria bacterium CG17_big_fil_post_rev_8_21_14_2_50_48_13]
EPITLLPGQTMPTKLRNMRLTYRFIPDPLREKPERIAAFSGTKYDDSRLYRETEEKGKVKKT